METCLGKQDRKDVGQLLRLVYLSASWAPPSDQSTLFDPLSVSYPLKGIMPIIPGATTCLPHVLYELLQPLDAVPHLSSFPTALSPCLLYPPLPTFQQKTQTWNMIIPLFVFLLCTVPLEAFHPRPYPGAKVRGPEWSWPALLVGRPMYSTVGVSIAQQATTYLHTSFPGFTIFSSPKGTSCFQLPVQKLLVQGRSPSAHTEAS